MSRIQLYLSDANIAATYVPSILSTLEDTFLETDGTPPKIGTW